MSIVPMKRLALCGTAGDKPAVLSALQDLGCLHLVPLQDPSPLEVPDPDQRRRARAAYRHLIDAPRPRQPWPGGTSFDLAATIEASLANKERLRIARDRRDFLIQRIEDLAPFGDFAFSPLSALRNRRFWFYVLPIKDKRSLAQLELPWAVVGRDNTRLFIAVIAADEPGADLLPVPRVHTGSRPLAELRDELITVEIEIERAEDEHAELSRHRFVLGKQLARAQDSDDLLAAGTLTHDEDRIFALSAWVPEPSVESINTLAKARRLAVVISDPAPDDMPPTLLSNPGRFEGAGALTTFYMTPAYRSWDPSLIVLASFTIFFAMILADAGYAAVLGLVLARYWGRLGQSDSGRQVRTISTMVVGASVIYGVLVGSYFGIAPQPDDWLGQIAIIDVNNFEQMMRLSIIVGVVHLSIAHVHGIVRGWGTGEAVVKTGWLIATVSGLLVWLAPSTLSYGGVALGLAGVFVGSGLDRAIASPIDWARRAIDGAMGLTGISKLFGDILSYMRLFALGLASASLAGTFNTLANTLADTLPGVGILLAILLLILGHGINLALGLMSGVVHGLRLNFIEFFGWGLSGEGRPFIPFARRERPS